ncbi:hypothetical protein HN51_054520 [Arachis hypogaea]
MSATQRKGKAKATTGKRKRGESAMSILDIMHDDSWREKNFTPQEKADQLLPANDPESVPGEDLENPRRTPAIHL